MFKKITTVLLAFVMLGSVAISFGSASAAAGENTQLNQQEIDELEKINNLDFNGIDGTIELTDLEKSKFEPYVELKQNSYFAVSKDAKKELNKEEYKKLKAVIKDTNKFIDNNKMEELNIVDPKQKELKESDGMMVMAAAFKNGKTAAETYWWGVRIYLSKYTINAIGGGVAVGGIWMPEPLISKILATLGVAMGLAPGGIQFDMNWYQISVAANPHVPMSKKYKNVRWQ